MICCILDLTCFNQKTLQRLCKSFTFHVKNLIKHQRSIKIQSIHGYYDHLRKHFLNLFVSQNYRALKKFVVFFYENQSGRHYYLDRYFDECSIFTKEYLRSFHLCAVSWFIDPQSINARSYKHFMFLIRSFCLDLLFTSNVL